MNVHDFLFDRPCLEEIDGFMIGLRYLIENPGNHVVQYPVIDAEVLGPIETYRARLLSGKDVPNPSKLERAWKYEPKKKPKRIMK